MKQLADPAYRATLSPSQFMHLSLKHTGDLNAAARKKFRHYYRQWGELESQRLAYWYDRQLNELLTHLIDRPAAKILDAGCGTGSESLYLAIKGADVTGIDVIPGMIKIASQRLAGLRKITGLDLAVQFETRSILDTAGQYDFIWMEMAFHHMEPRKDVLQHLADLLAPGGRLIFLEANGWNPLLQALFFKKRGFQTIVHTKTANGELIWGDERILFPGSLQRQLARVGLKKESCRYFRIFPSGPGFDRMMKLETGLSDLPFVGPFAPIYTHYNFVAIKPA